MKTLPTVICVDLRANGAPLLTRSEWTVRCAGYASAVISLLTPNGVLIQFIDHQG